ncbi:MAG: Gfo/Idh/MocA family oxidoreductase, partial [Oscillospiraceae bacterium]|nr:Gfo/Idh/MocA family oxidoreductase [Oscillospiraceae bacterium]
MITVGIIGAGRIGKVHAGTIANYVPGATIKTIADPFMNAETEAWAKSLGIQHTTKDYKEIIQDKEIDAVLICSSTDT